MDDAGKLIFVTKITIYFVIYLKYEFLSYVTVALFQAKKTNAAMPPNQESFQNFTVVPDRMQKLKEPPEIHP